MIFALEKKKKSAWAYHIFLIIKIMLKKGIKTKQNSSAEVNPMFPINARLYFSSQPKKKRIACLFQNRKSCIPEDTIHSPAGKAEPGLLPGYGLQMERCRIFTFISGSEAVCRLVYAIVTYTLFGRGEYLQCIKNPFFN